MLKILRHKNVAKAVLWGILILILPAFVIWGTGAGSGGDKEKGPSFAGTIDNKKISFNDFAAGITAIKSQIVMNYFDQPELLSTLMKSNEFLGKMAWDRLIMASEARRAKIKVSNGEVISYIKSHPIFLRDGTFDDRMYSYILRYNMGLEPRTFEEIIRENLEIKKLNDDLSKNITATDDEVLEAYRKDNEKFKISYVPFTSDSFLDKVVVDDDSVRKYYDDYKDEMVIPAKEGSEGKAGTVASFDEVKSDIKALLAQGKARELAIAASKEYYAKIKDAMAKDGSDLAAAAATLGLNAQDSELFAKGGYVEGLGEADRIIDEAVKLNGDEISAPIETRKGAIIFRVVERQKSSEEAFKKEKDEFSKKILESKKAIFLESWLRELEARNKLNIDLGDYEKYYR